MVIIRIIIKTNMTDINIDDMTCTNCNTVSLGGTMDGGTYCSCDACGYIMWNLGVAVDRNGNKLGPATEHCMHLKKPFCDDCKKIIENYDPMKERCPF